jgi:hypothetical protein
MEPQKESSMRTIGKWIVGFIKNAGIIVGIIWVGLQYGNRRHDDGYAQGHGDTQVLRQLIEHKDSQITDLNDQIKFLKETLDSSSRENEKLQALLKSNVVVSDTIIYWQDAIALFGGQVTIQCDDVDTTAAYWHARISGRIYEGGEPKFFDLNASFGDQTPFDFAGSKYLLVLLGCRRYEKGPGVKIAVYKY